MNKTQLANGRGEILYPFSLDLNLKNDFEKHIFELFPIIHTIKNKLYSEGAIYASMTGSGSTVYAIYDHEPRQRTCSQSLEIVKKIV